MGGQNSQPLKNGRVLMCLDETHDLLQQPVDLIAGDSFPNTMQFVFSTDKSHPGKDGKIIFIQGKQSMHKLDISDPNARQFSLEFELPNQ